MAKNIHVHVHDGKKTVDSAESQVLREVDRKLFEAEKLLIGLKNSGKAENLPTIGKIERDIESIRRFLFNYN